MKGDPWQVLGVAQGASPQEIKRAYRRRALKEHPDVNKAPDAKERWQELSQAYDVLSDPEKMRVWRLEQERAAGRRRGGGFRSGPFPKGPRQAAMDAEYDAGGDTFGAIFGDLLEGLGKEVSGDGTGLGKARKVGAFVLEELLDFLGGRGDDLSRPAEELAAAREELATLQQLDSRLRDESDTWAKKAEQAKQEGRTSDELESMQKVFDARERRKNVRRTVLRTEERVEYLEKVIFEYDKKQQAKAQGGAGAGAGAAKARTDGPGMYVVEHDRTQVTPTEDLSSNWIAELRKGATVKVVEVIRKVKDKRVRGRLESPAGWISLLNTETSYRWASRVAAPGPEPGPTRPPKPEFDANAALAELKRKQSSGNR